jgi:glutathione synthase/RimK-type ligase-like ATP-grasp enzyme
LDAPEVARRVVESGQAWLSSVSLGSQAPVLRACITSFQTERADVDALVAAVEQARRTGGAVERVPERRPHANPMRPRIGFATDSEHRALTPDDRLAVEALAREGVEVVPLVWSEPLAQAVDAVIVRSTWDYHLRLQEFLTWVRTLEHRGIPLWNPPGTIRRNVEKTYLLHLPERGVPVIPTVHLRRGSGASLGAVLKREGWAEAVVKPAVSGGAWNTWKATASGADEKRFAQDLTQFDLLVQPYMPDVVTHGEWSLLFFDGRYSHAVLKRPGRGEFRVQEHLGGSVSSAEALPSVRDQAARALGGANERTLYARVDGVVRDGLFELVELELVEPTLFFGTAPGSADRFAQAVLDWLKDGPDRRWDG